jgi:CHAT domain-containing protein/tetratricopeptide (TPR) repeat protein
MNGGESHLYSITVRPGQFLHIVVTQKGIDVGLVLVDQSGLKMVPYGDKGVVDSPNGTIGQEFVSLVSKKTEDERYQLQIVSPDKSAPYGCYEVVLEELRQAVPQDDDLIFAEDSFLSAFLLRNEDKESPMLRAVDILERTLSRLPPSRNPYLEAELLNLLGYAYHFIGNDRNSAEFVQKALDTYRRALPLWRPLHDRLNEAVALNGIANELDWMNRKSEALPYYTRAVRIWADDKSDPGAWGIGLLNIAFVNDILGNKEEAIFYYRQALPLLQQGGNIDKVNITLDKIGSAYSYLGDYDAAFGPLLQSLSLARSPGTKNRNGEAGALKTLGIVYNSAGDKKTALKYLNEALPIYEELKDIRGQADTINSIGAVTAYLGATEADLRKALGLLERARELYPKVHDPDPSDPAPTLNNIGGIYFLLKDYPRAIESYNSSLDLVRLGIKRHTHYANVDRGSEAKVLYNIARAKKGLGDLSAARKYIEEAIGIIESTRTNIRDQELSVSYFASVKFYYSFYIELLTELYEQHPDEELRRKAFEVSESSRARSLLDMLVGTSHIKTDDSRYKALTRPPTLAEIQRSLDPNTLLLEYSLGDERSFVWTVSTNSFNTYVLDNRQTIETAVDAVYDRLIARNVHFDFEERETKEKRIAEADQQLPSAANTLSDMLFRKVASQFANKRLLIIADGRLHYVPFAALPAPPSVPVPDNMRRIFAEGPVPLLATNEIVSIPSASVLTIIRQRASKRGSAPKPVSILADPIFNKDDERLQDRHPPGNYDPCRPMSAAQQQSISQRNVARSSDAESEESRLDRLPLTRCEAKRIMATAPKGSRLALDFDANGALVKSGRLAEYRIVHFATHSRINNVRPELSAIVLSRIDRHGNPRSDGYVRARDIYGLSFPADLIVLSSCKTGLGKNVEGEGLVGMSRAFLFAGASRVVVSLWDVNDMATTTLMSDFYKRMRPGKVPLSVALRSAQLGMLEENPKLQPYFWAAFILQGEWQ